MLICKGNVFKRRIKIYFIPVSLIMIRVKHHTRNVKKHSDEAREDQDCLCVTLGQLKMGFGTAIKFGVFHRSGALTSFDCGCSIDFFHPFLVCF